MRTHFVPSLLFLAAVSTAALAQQVVVRPTTAAPAASAPMGERQTWCRQYATWLISVAPTDGPTPDDVRQTHRFEIEFDTCVPNPQEYERQTRAEIPQHIRPS